ncbi:hypothetical protein RFI_11390 [Reticulomyxa filosa]|uniref:L-rhamnose mutarotase n=1 Tax=Reticulomyxa filosa TaxID=46433 RepID=X6NJ28_RETFI|nr:hypothetical protein RFI_11390 [Reticulomyxa filosa]|eukprot:ETO25749.1 hypothetical protein RFI_11390 [Reticulomyxa filosa]
MSSKITPVYGPTNPSPEKFAKMKIKRYGSIIGLKPEKEQYYRQLHSSTWPKVLERLKKSNIQNYSIYIGELEGKKYLFSYFEYTGDNFEKDMQLIAADPETQRWWKETDPCQRQLPNRKEGQNWSDLELVFLMAKM